MKLYLIPVLALTVLSSSCKKEYRCACVNGMVPAANQIKDYKTVAAANKTAAERKCKDTKYPDEYCQLEH